jgi:hypothetical protein
LLTGFRPKQRDRHSLNKWQKEYFVLKQIELTIFQFRPACTHEPQIPVAHGRQKSILSQKHEFPSEINRVAYEIFQLISHETII